MSKKGKFQSLIKTNWIFFLFGRFLVGLFFSPGNTLPILSGGNSKHANSEHTDTDTSGHMDTFRQTGRLRDRKNREGLHIEQIYITTEGRHKTRVK